MMASTQNGPEWIFRKKMEVEPSTQLDQTLTKQFSATRPGYRSFSQTTPPQDNLNSSGYVGRDVINSIQREKNKLTQLLKHNHYTPRVPVEHNCKQLLAEFKQNQAQQEVELLNREHERLRRLLSQR